MNPGDPSEQGLYPYFHNATVQSHLSTGCICWEMFCFSWWLVLKISDSWIPSSILVFPSPQIQGWPHVGSQSCEPAWDICLPETHPLPAIPLGPKVHASWHVHERDQMIFSHPTKVAEDCWIGPNNFTWGPKMAEKIHLFLLILSCSQPYRIFNHDPKKLKETHTRNGLIFKSNGSESVFLIHGIWTHHLLASPESNDWSGVKKLTLEND